MKTPTRQWPEDYLTWTGSFAELASTAAEVVSQLEPGAKLPTERSLRDYQQRGLLGRGAKAPGGNRSVFSFSDLDRVVTTKGMVSQKFTLEHAESLMNSNAPAADSPLSNMLYASPSSLSGSVASASVSAQPSSASDLVARLMAKGPAASPALKSPIPAVMANQLGGSVRGLRSVPLAPGPYAATAVEALRPTSWLTLYLDPSAAQGAPDEERALARAALQSVLDRLG